MKKLLLILLICLPLTGMAKEKKDNSDPKYLAGAVTLTDGKVTFSKEIKAPGLSQDAIFNQLLEWAQERFKPDGKLNSFVAYTNKDKGEIAVQAEEYVVFSSSALSLDRTRIYYQLFIYAKEGICDLEMTRIRYWYDEARDGGERYTAEEWITDDMALNKKQTKLAPICGKFRRETIDLKDQLFQQVADALGQKLLTANVPAAQAQQPASAVIPQQLVQTIPASTGELKEVSIEQLPSNLNELAAQGRITLTAENGETIDIKAENWSGFGKMFTKNVAYILFDQSRIAATALMEQSNTYTVSFYLNASTQPAIVITCKKAMAQKMTAEELKSLNQTVTICLNTGIPRTSAGNCQFGKVEDLFYATSQYFQQELRNKSPNTTKRDCLKIADFYFEAISFSHPDQVQNQSEQSAPRLEYNCDAGTISNRHAIRLVIVPPMQLY